MSGRLNTPVNQRRGIQILEIQAEKYKRKSGEIQTADRRECQTGVRLAGRAVLASMECLFSSAGFHSCDRQTGARHRCYQANKLRKSQNTNTQISLKVKTLKLVRKDLNTHENVFLGLSLI